MMKDHRIGKPIHPPGRELCIENAVEKGYALEYRHVTNILLMVFIAILFGLSFAFADDTQQKTEAEADAEEKDEKVWQLEEMTITASKILNA